MPIIELVNATIYQRENPVLTEVTFSINKGEFVYLIGKTGSGKSSLLKTLYAELPTDEAAYEQTSITARGLSDALDSAKESLENERAALRAVEAQKQKIRILLEV